MILEHEPGKIAINPDKFDKLITALRTAVDNDGTLDKEATSYNDIFEFQASSHLFEFQCYYCDSFKTNSRGDYDDHVLNKHGMAVP
jgi:hypothetical protein